MTAWCWAGSWQALRQKILRLSCRGGLVETDGKKVKRYIRGSQSASGSGAASRILVQCVQPTQWAVYAFASCAWLGVCQATRSSTSGDTLSVIRPSTAQQIKLHSSTLLCLDKFESLHEEKVSCRHNAPYKAWALRCACKAGAARGRLGRLGGRVMVACGCRLEIFSGY